MIELKIPSSEFRAIPIPGVHAPDGCEPKMSHFYVRVEDVPAALSEWLKVNPRIPTYNKKDLLSGPVAKAMVTTLDEEPHQFAVKNQGIYLLVDSVEWHKEKGGHGIVTLKLTNPSAHGVVNGGHTFMAIRQVVDGRAAEDEGGKHYSGAYVRFHVMEGMGAHVAELAEGLNRSMQVDNPSLENLKGTFEKIKEAMKGKRGEDQIQYKQGEPGEVDILHVLTLLALFNLDDYPDPRKSLNDDDATRSFYPHDLFGQRKRVLDRFVEDQNGTKDPDTGVSTPPRHSFDKIIPRTFEILRLSEEVQKQALAQTGKAELGRTKVGEKRDSKGNKKIKKVSSPEFRNAPTYFAEGSLGGKFFTGWLYPMIGAFRANLSTHAWKEGRFEWLVAPDMLLPKVINEMARIIKQEHEDNNGKPAEVGRKEAAYRACYSVVKMALAEEGKLERS